MEIIHQQVQRKKEKIARLADLQRKIDEATEEVRHLAQDEQDRRPQHKELRQEGLFNEDGWYDDFNHDTFTFDDCRRFETGGSLGRRVKCRRMPQPRWVGARPSAKGGKGGRRRA
jgi:FtsZ-binding cell division protein ZapB